MKVSVIILTKNRAALLERALLGVKAQTFSDYEVVIVDDGSTDNTQLVIKTANIQNLQIILHPTSWGITKSRAAALLQAHGDYVAFLDDDDEWVDSDKLKKQVTHLDENSDVVLLGGGMEVSGKSQATSYKLRPESDEEIRNSMLFRNNFFTSTVLFRKSAALQAGGFEFDGVDLAEDYDLWLRMGKLGKMYNFQEVFTRYAKPKYNKAKFKQFLQKQLSLIGRFKKDYPGYFLASLILHLRLLLGV